MSRIPTPRALFSAPEDGCVLVEADYAQAELRVGAKIAKCESMLDAIEKGEDLHDQTNHNLFGLDPSDTEWFEYRQVAKRCNFALIYNVGPDTFRADLEKHTGRKLTRSEATDLINRWRGLYPEFGQVNRRAEKVALRKGYLTLITGKRRYWMPGESGHKAYNAVVQGTIAELLKLLMIEVDTLWPDALVLQIHDSLVLSFPEEEMQQDMEKLVELGSSLATDLLAVPMLLEAKEW